MSLQRPMELIGLTRIAGAASFPTGVGSLANQVMGSISGRKTKKPEWILGVSGFILMNEAVPIPFMARFALPIRKDPLESPRLSPAVWPEAAEPRGSNSNFRSDRAPVLPQSPHQAHVLAAESYAATMSCCLRSNVSICRSLALENIQGLVQVSVSKEVHQVLLRGSAITTRSI